MACQLSKSFATLRLSVRENQQNVSTATAFYQDRSGRAKVQATVGLEGSDELTMQRILSIARRQLSDPPKDGGEAVVVSNANDFQLSLMFQFKSRDTDILVEGVTLVSARIVSEEAGNESVVLFELEIMIRSTADCADKYHSYQRAVTSTLEISAVLVCEDEEEESNRISVSEAQYNSFHLGLLSLEMGGGIVRTPSLRYSKDSENFDESRVSSSDTRKPAKVSQRCGIFLTHTKPTLWNLRLVMPLFVQTTSMGGARAALGATLVSLNISHSNNHPFSVIIKSIAFYSGHSRLYQHEEDKRYSKKMSPTASVAAVRRTFSASTPRGDSALSLSPSTVSDPQSLTSMLSGSNAVIDMTRHVRWSYAQGTAPTLPITLLPHEAINTVIQIDAGEDLRSRTFLSPVAVTAVVLDNNNHFSTASVITADAVWTTNEDRNLMLLMAKDERNSGDTSSSNRGLGSRSNTRGYAVNTAVVSEVNGYTFGVWGLSGDDDGTTRQNRDHELLAVDAALLLGDVKGQHSVEAELRFVPLREGTLDVPNLKLYDKAHGKWYNCIHCLKIIAAAS